MPEDHQGFSYFTTEEIERLAKLQDAFGEEEAEQDVLIRHRLEFLRWLITTGRMTEHSAELS